MHIFHSNWIPWFSKSQICSQVSKPTNSAEPRASHPSPLDQSKEELDLYWKVFFSEILISMFSPRRGTCERLLWLLAEQLTQPFILQHLYLFKYTHIYVSAILQQFPQTISVKISPDVVSGGAGGHAWWFQVKSSHRVDDNSQTPEIMIQVANAHLVTACWQCGIK